MDILDNREIASIFWLLVVLIVILFSPKMVSVRASFRGVMSAFFVRQIMTILTLMIIYMSLIIYVLSKLNLWNIGQIKNTIFWGMSVGFMSLFKLQSIKKDKAFFKHSVIDSFKLLAIIQFIICAYTFPLWLEILIAPILTFIGAMLTVASSDIKYNQVKIILGNCLSLYGVILIIYTIYMLITNFGEFGNEKTLFNFVVPSLLTLFYLPFIFFMLAYSTYEEIFIRLPFFIKDGAIRWLAKLYAVILFNVQLNTLERWFRIVSREPIECHNDLINTFKYIYRVKRAEKKPRKVPYELGWSPYEAKNFLSSKGLNTGFYDKVFNEEWFASSNIVEFSDGINPDNATYCIEGTENVANTLKIIINVNDANRSDLAQHKLLELANVLSGISIKQNLSKQMINAIANVRNYSETCNTKNINLIIEPWNNHRLNGYSIKFIISSIQQI